MCGGFIFSGLTNVQSATFLQSDPFRSRCFSGVEVSMCTDILQGLIHSISVHLLGRFTGAWICFYSPIETVIKTPYSNLFYHRAFCSYVQSPWEKLLSSSSMAKIVYLQLSTFLKTDPVSRDFLVIHVFLYSYVSFLLLIYTDTVLGTEFTFINH